MKTKLTLTILAAVLFGAMAVDATWPLAAHMRDAVIDDWGDGLLNAYILRWNLHQLVRDPLDLFHASMYHPAPYSLALSENMLGLSLLLWPVELLTRDSLFLLNFMILFSFWSLAMVGFGVFRRWTGSWIIGFIAGTAIGFAQPRITQLGHAQLLNYQPMVLSIFFAERWLNHFRARDAFGFFAALYAQLLFGIYLAVFNLVFITAFIPVVLCVRWRRVEWMKFLRQALAGGVIVAVLALPIYLPYQYVRDEFGIQVESETLDERGVNLTDFLRFPGANLLHGARSWKWRNPYSPIPWEHEVGLSWVMYGLGALGLIGGVFVLLNRRWNVRLTTKALFAGSVAATLVCLSLMFGPRLHLLNGPLEGVPMPYRLYYAFFPGFEGMRVPARWILPASIGWTMIALLPLGWIYPALRHRDRWRVVLQCILVAILVVLIVEIRTKPLGLKSVPSKDNLPPEISGLSEMPSAPLFIYPLTHGATYNFLYLYYNTYFWHPMVNGCSGHLPRVQGQRLDALISTFPQSEALDLLAELGVRRILILKEHLPDQETATALDRKLREWVDVGRLTDTGHGSLYELVR